MSQKIAEWSGGAWLNPPDGCMTGFCFDARQIQPGQCFVALSGGARDGHDFIEQAAQGGAMAAIVERAQPIALPQLQVRDSLCALAAIAAAVRSQFSKPVIAITGSCGKTSTKEMLRRLLGDDRTHATAGNWNNRIGVPMTLFGLDSAQHDFAVIEAGINQPHEMQALGQMIQADLNVLTNIGPAHLELLDSLENVAVEKSLLAKSAMPGSPVVLPAEVLQFPAYAQLADRAIALLQEGTPAPAVMPRAIVRYAIHTLDDAQQLILDGRKYRIASLSRGIARNAALAIIAASELGIAEADICKRIEAWRPTGSRGRIETFGEQTFYIDCYNANPSSMADALAAFRRSVSPDVAHLYILGGMNELGAHAAEHHYRIGNLLQLRSQDRVVFVGPDTLVHAYLAGALAAGLPASQLKCVDHIEKVKSIVAPFVGAIFLKGSRSYQLEKLLPPQDLVA
ncbi:UDP-N-acetylmuramoyl-tripeptide--D-alanyl-D-alanine ligase [Coraliomargarita algicola]|uniref:UDP-N-acetylmuramoyl-tripeptide--D-alanyl-D-alanine ligase n=1 Tax=Coraliomargarita algicola TaxID=3092156 RepID=A0ABZ0RK41_9BACT|nr:UDP-N-acetylmuramoyl-tripeptide--D-alanyl-D-alanine ligase [Coraliomargarita sp. J2-16]WPJ95287.1 UDP-N-acetylmuramoyl-tripeptide--D-alanyl-D-alanine ligase [Coraliomargarita sp. J2-16]